MSVERVRRIELPRIGDDRGHLTFVEGGHHIPFEIRRVYYLYDVAPGARRGAHAHRELEQVFVAVAGAFNLELDDGRQKSSYRLDTASVGLHVPRMIWRDLTRFTDGAVCLVLASLPYDEADYIRDYSQFLESVRLSP